MNSELTFANMGWLRFVGSLRLYVSFAEYSLFYRSLLQKRPITLRSLLIEATPYPPTTAAVCFDFSIHLYEILKSQLATVAVCVAVCVLQRVLQCVLHWLQSLVKDSQKSARYCCSVCLLQCVRCSVCCSVYCIDVIVAVCVAVCVLQCVLLLQCVYVAVCVLQRVL